MQKIKRGTGFRGVCEYALEDGRGQIIGGNMTGITPQELAKEFGQSRKIREDIEKPVWHNSLRLPKSECIPAEKWEEIANAYMEKMGFSSLHQRVYVMHDDVDGQHIHIIASRIDLTGKIYLGQNENLKSTSNIQELELKFGLNITKGPSPDTPKPDFKKPKKAEDEMAIRTGEPVKREVLQQLVKEAWADKPNIIDFIERLKGVGVTSRPNVASTGTMNGFSFEYGGIAFKASDLGNVFKWKSLSEQIDYDKERDSPALIRLKQASEGINSENQDASGTYQGNRDDSSNDVKVNGSDARDSGTNSDGDDRSQKGHVGSREKSARLSQSDAINTRRTEKTQTAESLRDIDKLDNASVKPGALDIDAAKNVSSLLADLTGASKYTKKKLEQITKQHDALKADEYAITLVPRFENAKPFVLGKDKNTIYDFEKLTKEVAFLSKKNAQGYDIYIRLKSKIHDYILIDDVTKSSIDIIKSKYSVALVQQSSVDNFQVIIKTSKKYDTEVINYIAKELNKRYGDPKIFDANRNFRLAGYANKKPKNEGIGRDGLTIVTYSNDTVCSRIEAIAEQRIEAIKARKAVSQVQKTETELVSSEVVKKLEYWHIAEPIHFWVHKKGYPLDNSIVDFRVIKEMLRRGYDDAYIKNEIASSSPGIDGRHKSYDDYFDRSLLKAKLEIASENIKNDDDEYLRHLK